MSRRASLLTNIEPHAISLREMVVLDWYDYPVEGVIALSRPSSDWHFRVIASRRTDAGDDDLLYLLSKIPDGMVKRIRAATEGESTSADVVIPDGRYNSNAARVEADRLIDEATEHVGRDAAVVRTDDLRSYREVWLYG